MFEHQSYYMFQGVVQILSHYRLNYHINWMSDVILSVCRLSVYPNSSDIYKKLVKLINFKFKSLFQTFINEFNFPGKTLPGWRFDGIRNTFLCNFEDVDEFTVLTESILIPAIQLFFIQNTFKLIA